MKTLIKTLIEKLTGTVDETALPETKNPMVLLIQIIPKTNQN